MTTPTKVLDLRGLSATERDARVNEAMAIHVAGWHSGKRSRGEHPQYWYKGNDIASLGDLPPYATSCDAVREIERKLDHRSAVEYAFKLSVVVGMDENSDMPWDEIFKIATASALNRCIALLRANGWEVVT